MSRVATRVCPRCGCSFSYIKEKKINGRVYLYAVHYYRDDSGRRRMRECYLGPKDYYEYVTKMHEKEGLVLKGLICAERLIEYLDAIIDYMKNNNVDKNLVKYILERVEEIKRKFRET